MSDSVLTLPRMGETMESGRVVAWLRRPGERFSRGDTIVEIETDKTTVEVPALTDGTMVEIIAGEGSDVAVGAPLCRIEGGATDVLADAATPEAPVDAAPDNGNASEDVLVLPRLGETMESGRVGHWMVEPGQRFERGATLVEIESDKTTVELPALLAGELLEILAPTGSDIAVGAPLCRVRGAGATASRPAAAQARGETGRSSPPSSDMPDRTPSERERGVPGEARPRATPRARRLARENGVRLADVTGTGRRGRIEARDITGSARVRGHAEAASRIVPLATGRLALREWQPEGAVRGTALLLHGFAGDAQTWTSAARLLAAAGRRVLAPDLPGHGDTTIEAPAIETIADAVCGLVEAEDLRDLDLVAHSMGAIAAVRAASSLATRIRRLTLVAPAGMGAEIDASFVTGMAAVARTGALVHLLRRIAVRPPVLSDAQLGAMAASLGPRGRLAALADTLVANGMQGEDITRRLAELAVPLRIVWGLEDRIVPWTQVRAAPTRAAIHLLADAGHMPHWDRPREFAALFD